VHVHASARRQQAGERRNWTAWQVPTIPQGTCSRAECPGVTCDQLWASGMRTVCLQLPSIRSKSASHTPEAEGRKMRGQPVSGEVQLNVFRRGPLKMAEGRSSFKHVQSTKRRTFQFLNSQRGPSPDDISDQSSLCSLHLLQPQSGWRLDELVGEGG